MSAGILVFIIFTKQYHDYQLAANILIACIALSIFISLFVSFYIYDYSDLYKFSWLETTRIKNPQTILNIHAGFDETSFLLKEKFPSAKLLVADFYDPAIHTEPSIKRARKVYPAFPGTMQVDTRELRLPKAYTEKIFIMLSAHEIRATAERIAFFQELHRILTPTGELIVTEHLRDMANFLAFNIGFFHFHSRASWLKTFANSAFTVVREIKTTPFITTFILQKNDLAS